MRRTIWPWARPLIGLALLAVLVWRLGATAFLDGVRATDIRAILAALGIGLVTTVLSAWRWCLVARRLGLRLSLRAAVADYYRSLFLNSVLPGGVLGDVQRAVRHGRHAGDLGRGVRAVVLERTGGQLVLIAVAVLVLVARPSLTMAEAHHIAAVPAMALLAVAGCLLVLVVAVAVGWARRASRWHRALSATLSDIRTGLFSRQAWPGVLVLSAGVLAGHLTVFLVAARAAGSTAPVGELVPLMVLTLVAAGLPVNIGGWGPRESVSALAFGAEGLGAAQGLTIAVVYGVLTLVASVPGAAVLVVRYTGWLRSGRRPQGQLEERVVAEREPAHGRA